MHCWGENGHFKFWWGCLGCQPGPSPHVMTLDARADQPLHWIMPERHVTLRLACPYPEHKSGPRPNVGHLVLGLPCPGRLARPVHHVARPGAWVALSMRWVKPNMMLGSQIIIFFSINTFNDNKNNNFYIINNNIFDINTLNYNKINIQVFFNIYFTIKKFSNKLKELYSCAASLFITNKLKLKELYIYIYIYIYRNKSAH